jgi:hypothetical protein
MASAVGTQLLVEKALHDTEPLLVVEERAAVLAAVHHDELRRQTGSSVGAMDLVRLIDRRLRVLIAVQQQQRRITESTWKTGLASFATSGTASADRR